MPTHRIDPVVESHGGSSFCCYLPARLAPERGITLATVQKTTAGWSFRAMSMSGRSISRSRWMGGSRRSALTKVIR